MKNNIFRLAIVFVALALFAFSNSDHNEDLIIGTWSFEEGKGHAEIYKHNDKFFARTIWLKEPLKNGVPKTDSKNPNPALKSRKLIGMTFLNDMVFDGQKWEGGKIYDPGSGKEYSCIITLVNENKIDVRGYVGFSWLGESQEWNRILK